MTRFTPEVVDRLLDGLANDDAFRAEFERDARAALRSIGHETPAKHVGVEGKDPVLPLMTLKGGLASKEKIKASKDSLAAAYKSSAEVGTAGVPFGPFTPCAE